jgi:hypothetical protein
MVEPEHRQYTFPTAIRRIKDMEKPPPERVIGQHDWRISPE